jgi:hypothetical protein
MQARGAASPRFDRLATTPNNIASPLAPAQKNKCVSASSMNNSAQKHHALGKYLPFIYMGHSLPQVAPHLENAQPLCHQTLFLPFPLNQCYNS